MHVELHTGKTKISAQLNSTKCFMPVRVKVHAKTPRYYRTGQRRGGRKNQLELHVHKWTSTHGIFSEGQNNIRKLLIFQVPAVLLWPRKLLLSSCACLLDCPPGSNNMSHIYHNQLSALPVPWPPPLQWQPHPTSVVAIVWRAKPESLPFRNPDSS